MKKIKNIILFLVVVLLIPSVTVHASGPMLVPPQYPLVNFEITTENFPMGSSFQIQLQIDPINAANSSMSGFTWQVSGSDFSVSSTGVLTTPNYSAKTTLTVTHKTSGLTRSVIIEYTPFQSGFYRIKNRETGKYLEPILYNEYDDITDYQTNAINNHISINQIWRIEKQENNSYTIRTVHQNESKRFYLCTANGYAEIDSFSNDSNFMWRFAYRNGAYSLFTGNNATNSLIHSTSNTDSPIQYAQYSSNILYNDEWILEPVNMSAYLAAVNDYEHEQFDSTDIHSKYIGNVRPNLEIREYIVSSEGIGNYSVSEDNVKNALRTSGIFVSDSHGNAEETYSYINLGYEHLTSTEICENNGQIVKINMSQCDLAIFMGCLTAESSYPLPQAAVDAGAKYAIGTHFEIYCEDALAFLYHFFANYKSDFTVEESLEEAIKAVYGGNYLNYMSLFELYYN